MLTMYHGTSMRNAERILLEGLKPHGGNGGDAWAHEFAPDTSQVVDDRPNDSVFLTADLHHAKQFSSITTQVNHEDTGVVLQINLPKRIADKLVDDELDWGAKRYDGSIPAKYIKVLERIPHPSLQHLD